MIHTPGPWAIGRYGFIQTENGDTICDVLMTKEGEANSNLIAAAPDMLDALKGLVGLAHDGQKFSERIEAAKSAIAKAEGKS